VRPAIEQMVAAARTLRGDLANKGLRG
jgi:hypothetical protein